MLQDVVGDEGFTMPRIVGGRRSPDRTASASTSWSGAAEARTLDSVVDSAIEHAYRNPYVRVRLSDSPMVAALLRGG
ncbi:hypothetical protein CGZ93_01265 [Enemella dayhoffiae]|uniref:Uncharacterized protein n=1 Tax=Enemella dayhoffiae TaxID=2016507 RepID=A0A255HBW0_9ACTN|nr:hypothetical protein CGZ93_01265 [Enemella dayhoffiae]